MIKKLKILVFPGLTVIFLFIAWLTGGGALRIMLNGERAEGAVSALIRGYEKQYDLLIDIRQDLILTQADGQTITAGADRNGIQRLEDYTVEQLAALNVVRGDKADGIKRFLQREADKESDERIIVVERTEHAMFVPNLTDPALAPALLQDATETNTIITRILFTYIGGTDEQDELKTDVMRDVSRTLNGKEVECASQDFILYEKDFRYTFRPVFSFEAAGEPVSIIADTGARMSPRGGHKLGDKLKIAYLPDDPQQAIMLSDFGIMKEQDPLDALNSFFNLTFGQWFFPAVSLVVAFVYLLMSVITISIVLKPVKTENADTVDEEALAKMS
jgi:hypothetical protein